MEISNIKVDKMRYQTNSVCYLLVMLSVALSVIALFMLINYDNFGKGSSPQRVVPDFRIGLEIALGIVLMLITFLAAEKVKYYDKIWSYYGLFILAGINFLRVFNIPIYANKKGWIPNNIYISSTILLLMSSFLLALAGGMALMKVTKLKNYMKEIDEYGNSSS